MRGLCFGVVRVRHVVGCVLGIALVACGGESQPAGPDASAGGAGPHGPTEPAPLAASPGKDEDPSVIRALDGTYYVAWYSNRTGKDALYVKSSPDGLMWSPDRALTAGDFHDFGPCLFQSRDRRFHVVWWRGSVGANGLVGSIWYMSSADTIAWTPPVALSGESAFAWAPTMTERAPGELIAAWSSNASGSKQIFVAKSIDAGISWSAPLAIADPGFNADLPSLGTLSDAGLVLLWQRYALTATGASAPFSDPSNELVYATSIDGATWSAPFSFTSDPADQQVPDVMGSLFRSADPSGVSVAWTSTRASGASLGDIFSLGLSKAPPSATNLARLTDGSGRDYEARLAQTDVPGLYLMAWVSETTAGNPDVYYRFVAP